MSDLINEFLIHKELSEGRSALTSNKYRKHLLQLETFLKPTSICDATRDQLVSFTGMHAHKELKLSPAARRPLVAAVRGLYSWLKLSGRIDYNTAEKIPYPKSGKRLPVAMQLSNAEKILMQPDLDTFIGVRDLAILSVLIGCGPRVSGLCSLNESDLIFYNDDDMEQLAIRFTEKGDKERVIPAPMDTYLMIRAYLGHEHLDNVDRTLDDGDRVLFVSVGNRMIAAHDYHGEHRRIGTKSIDNFIKAYGHAAGIPRDQLSAHSFRHLFGAEMAEDDVSTLTSQALLGHADPKTTEIYFHLALRKLKRVINKSNPLAKIETPVRGLARILRN